MQLNFKIIHYFNWILGSMILHFAFTNTIGKILLKFKKVGTDNTIIYCTLRLHSNWWKYIVFLSLSVMSQYLSFSIILSGMVVYLVSYLTTLLSLNTCFPCLCSFFPSFLSHQVSNIYIASIDIQQVHQYSQSLEVVDTIIICPLLSLYNWKQNALFLTNLCTATYSLTIV